MIAGLQRRWIVTGLASLAVLLLLYGIQHRQRAKTLYPPSHDLISSPDEGTSLSAQTWRELGMQYPVEKYAKLPTGPPGNVPRIQHDFKKSAMTKHRLDERRRRREKILETFKHSWNGYKQYAWLHDEVTPVTGAFRDPFGGWGATLVDSLDTLWIMGLVDEFDAAVAALSSIDFSRAAMDELNVFETVIRYIGGLLGAYDVSGGRSHALLTTARDLGDMIYHAFDTPNRMPMTRWKWRDALIKDGKGQVAPSSGVIAELGSLSMEFTRLSQLTGDDKYFDAIDRITKLLVKEQPRTKMPGLWPLAINLEKENLHLQGDFSLGGMADSVYEYLPKQYLLLNGRDPVYRDMYLSASSAWKQHLIYQPMVPDDKMADLEPLIMGSSSVLGDEPYLKTEGQHLTCFAGGMSALGSRAFALHMGAELAAEELAVARRLSDGCVWSYRSTPLGIGPEVYQTTACQRGRAAIDRASDESCKWNDSKWDAALREHWGSRQPAIEGDDAALARLVADKRLPGGLLEVTDARYLLRPEAVETLFVLWRATGDARYEDHAWAMFAAVDRLTRTAVAHAPVANVMGDPAHVRLLDSMESFWTAETLKYFYLIFADPELVSLDEFVLNTEAHPFRWRGKVDS